MKQVKLIDSVVICAFSLVKHVNSLVKHTFLIIITSLSYLVKVIKTCGAFKKNRN